MASTLVSPDASPTKIVVIGAGWSGLVTAKTYLQLASSRNNLKRHPIDLIVLDDSNDPGGVWSSSRLYPGLLANSPTGLYEFSDFSMVDAQHLDYHLIDGNRVQEYLEAYARRFNIYDKIRFGVTVTSVERRSGVTRAGEQVDSEKDGGEAEYETQGWTLHTSHGEVIECDKVIIASGLHSKPKIPTIATAASAYTGISIHSKELGRRHKELQCDKSIRDVVVIGGCKSAVEACSLFLDTTDPPLSPKRVHWIIRPSEQGVPIVVLDPDMKPNLVAVNNTRLFSIFSPSSFVTSGFWYAFLHSGTWWLGTLLMTFFWTMMSYVVKSQVGYETSRNGKLIEPKGGSLFFDAPYISVLVKGSKFLKVLHADDDTRLKVYRASPIGLKRETLHGSNPSNGDVTDSHQDARNVIVIQDAHKGTIQSIAADAVIWCTGWTASLDFFDIINKIELGLPYPTDDLNDEKVSGVAQNTVAGLVQEQDRLWAQAGDVAEMQTSKTFPYLYSKNRRPRAMTEQIKTSPFRLHNQVLPVSCLPTSNQKADRSIAFNSFTSSSQTAIVAELCALYAVAWLEDLLPSSRVPNREQCIQSIANLQSWRNARYGPRGMRDPEIILEIQGLLDRICGGLGITIERKRKRKGILREWLEPYRAGDYMGVIEEFLGTTGRDST